MRKFRSGRLFAALLAGAVLNPLVGCTAVPVATPGSAGLPASSATSSAGTPSAVTPLGDLPKDPSGTLQVSPVPFDGKTVVVATFSDAVTGRPVSLQSRVGSGWQEVALSAQDKKGQAEFQTDTARVTYRAVALEFVDGGKELSALTTGSASAAAQWKQVFSDDFSASTLRRPFSVRSAGGYFAPRYCAASQPSMVKLGNGVLSLGVAMVGKARTNRVKANVARVTSTAASKACPDGVYDNAMIGTQGRYLFTYGTVAARMKFPAQRGMHSAAWLQTSDGTDVEIDFMESFGFGSKIGIQNMLHPKGRNNERLDLGVDVKNVPGVSTREWWDQYHVVSMDWSAKGYVFRIDGVETFRTTKALSKRPHFLVLSLQTSDYETNRLTPSELPASFDVDWIKVWQRP